jgi:hypothetical protein
VVQRKQRLNVGHALHVDAQTIAIRDDLRRAELLDRIGYAIADSSWQELKNTSLSSAARCATGTYDLNSVVALMRTLLTAAVGPKCRPIMSGPKKLVEREKTAAGGVNAVNCVERDGL